ncbi:MAG TPA: peptidylprolyl isomerase [Leucothrix mucor]|uniref:peptidylprolyl isomerase n=1 Tax=Leucothrix mucor TaxID=45248 RepID=A0A7V2WU54_LEUMU|nr:peptidylprolyl isomerase [Leucothrix mucor]
MQFTTKMNQSIKKPLLATAILISLGLAVSVTHAKDATKDSVVATVNGDKIMKSALDGYLKVIKRSPSGAKVKPAEALDDLVATELALQEAKKTDILSRDAVKKKIADFTRNVILTTWTKEKVKSFKISDDEIKAEYDATVKKLASKEFNARHILLKKEDEAKALIKEIANGADFAKLAKEKSTGPSSSNGGSLGWFKAQTMVPAFATAVKAMKKGEVSKEPVKTQFGWHIIKLEDSRDAKLPALKTLKSKIERKISQKKMLAYMDEIKKTADVKITLPKEEKKEEKKVEKKD